jgi:hypothetical protein
VLLGEEAAVRRPARDQVRPPGTGPGACIVASRGEREVTGEQDDDDETEK